MSERSRAGERGSAMVLAILVSVILTLLGVSFLMMAETENRIAENEKLATQALYAAESGARAVKRWFDDPAGGGALPLPSAADLDRSLRVIDDDGPGPGAPVVPGAGQLYKDGVDLDGDGADDLFDRPYRGDVRDTLLGTEDGPDARIEGEGYLDDLSAALFGDFPDAPAGVRARIDRIDLYAPPYARTVGGWMRFGVGTVKVIARIYDDDQPVAERTVQAVLNEAPYAGPFGPLHSCAGLTFQPEPGEPLPLRWGAVTATGSVLVSTSVADFPASLPRSTSGFVQLDPVWGPFYDATLEQFKAALVPGATALGDPWFRLLTEETIVGLPAPDQPAPSPWRDWNGTSGPPGAPVDHSNLLQRQFMECPEYDYATWKMIAASGGYDVRYFAWAAGDTFRENGRGPARSFRDITNGAVGVFFFDTRDGLEPADDDSNLTPDITLSGGSWSFRGMIYLNASTVHASAVAGANIGFVAPGEPFEDLDQDGLHEPDKNGNGVHDPGDESWVDLTYPTVLDGPALAGASGTRAAAAPTPIAGTASLWGVLYTSGTFEATGASRHHGSIVARRGVVQEAGAAGRPEIYWDQRIVTDWPPPGWALPRIVVSSWITDL